MLSNPYLVAVPASVLLWSIGLSLGGLGGVGRAATGGAVDERVEPLLRIERQATGRSAERLIVESLLEGFDNGLELVAVAEEIDQGAGRRRIVELGMDGHEKRIVRVSLDHAGRVASAVVLVAPGCGTERGYRRKGELVAALGAGRVVHSLALEPLVDGGARLVGTMRGGRRFAVYLGDFEALEQSCAC